jgi:cell division protein FtsW (lipid II flippase)
MLVLLLIATVLSVIASLVLGTRLLRLGMRTREVPELAIGTSFIVAGVIGYVVMLAGSAGQQEMPAGQAQTLFDVGFTLIGVGICCLYVFVWRVFHPDDRWAMWIAGIGCLLVLCTTTTISPAQAKGPLFWIGELGRSAAGAWGAVEALRYWILMRRRLKIGLADPVVANRFLLWGLANVATLAIMLSSSLISQSQNQAEQVALSTASMWIIASLTIVTAALQWLAFFPTGGYVAWIQRRAEGQSAPLPG